MDINRKGAAPHVSAAQRITRNEERRTKNEERRTKNEERRTLWGGGVENSDFRFMVNQKINKL
ncbi:MAG: hypothetical protein RBS37_09875 [Bacteroidales bacterium]|nr:hypothetical protein [Bacteroidales bacterium]